MKFNLSKRDRLAPADRKNEILLNAISLAEKKGYAFITIKEISEMTGVTRGLVHHYFKSVRELQDAIISLSILKNNTLILEQAKAMRHNLNTN